MNPVTRITTLATTAADSWSLEQLVLSAHDALSRWQAARLQLGIAFGFPPRGVIETVAPDFRLSADLVSLAPSDHSKHSSIVIGFLTWATCPATQGVPNPFDPMLDFFHHGGTFSTEHGFIDICSADGQRAGIPMSRYATQCA